MSEMYSILSSAVGLFVKMLLKGGGNRAVTLTSCLKPHLRKEEIILFSFFAATLVVFRYSPVQIGMQVASLLLYHQIKLQQLDCNKALLLICKQSKHSYATLQCIQQYLSEGANVNVCDSHNRNALMILFDSVPAANFDGSSFQIVTLLIEKGITVNHTDHNGENVIVKIFKKSAICYSEPGFKTVELLTERGADVNCINSVSKVNPLICLLQQNIPGNAEVTKVIRLLIKNGLDVNHVKSNGRNALMQLCLSYNGYSMEIAGILINEAKINVNSVDINKENALFTLLGNRSLEKSKQMELMSLLVKAGININQVNSFGENALCRFLKFRSNSFGDCLTIAGKLVELGIDINCKARHKIYKTLEVGSCFADCFLEYLSAYRLKPKKDSLIDGELIIKQSVKLLGSELSGRVLIKVCKTFATNNLYDIVSVFSQLEDIVNCEDTDGCNALIALFHSSNARSDVIFKSVSLLLKGKINANHIDNRGNNALMALVQSNHFCLSEMVRLLIEHETDVHQVNVSGENALIKFCQHLNSLKETPFYSVTSAKEIVQLLVERGIDVDHSDENDRNALITLFSSPFNRPAVPYATSVASVLVKSGAYIDSIDASSENVLFKLANGFTAIDDHGDVIDMMNILIDNGANVNYAPPGCDNPILILLARARDLSPRIQSTQSLRAFREALARLSSRSPPECTATKQDGPMLKLLRSSLNAGWQVNCQTLNGNNALELLAGFYRDDDLIDVIELLCERGIALRDDDGQLWIQIVFCLIRSASFSVARLSEISLLLSDRGLTIPSLSDNAHQRQLAERVVQDKFTHFALD